MARTKFRFDGWVLDPESGDLERAGNRIRLQERPTRALQELLAHARSLVTREQLIARLWPRGVVDFDTGLNTVIRKLRSALGDVAETPRYIETLPRRGYRFIGALDPEGARAEAAPQSGAEAALRHVRVAISVLPFSSESGDAEQQAISEGVTEDIITELSRWRMLEVRSRLASSRYRGTEIDIDRVARELNVRFVVEGRVRRMGQHIRITAQLIDAATGRQVWGDHFDRLQTEFFAVQDQVVQRIVSTLVGRIQVIGADRARRKQPANLAAYECVLQGNALQWDDPAGLAEATRLFERAIEIDPGYGMAHALLAIMRMRHWQEQPGDSTAELDEAYHLAMRAVELDDSESTCHSMLAHVCLWRRLYELALQHMSRAVESTPTANGTWRTWRWCSATRVGPRRLCSGASGPSRSIRISTRRGTGRVHMVLRHYREALAMFEHIPLRTYRDTAYMAGCHARLGENKIARALVAECLAKQPGFSIRQMLMKEPFKLVCDAEHLEESLRLAGLPE